MLVHAFPSRKQKSLVPKLHLHVTTGAHVSARDSSKILALGAARLGVPCACSAASVPLRRAALNCALLPWQLRREALLEAEWKETKALFMGQAGARKNSLHRLGDARTKLFKRDSTITLIRQRSQSHFAMHAEQEKKNGFEYAIYIMINKIALLLPNIFSQVAGLCSGSTTTLYRDPACRVVVRVRHV